MLKRLLFAGLLLLRFASVSYSIELTVAERSGIDRIHEPVTCGVPLPEGWASSADELVLIVNGQAVPCEFREAARWPDGSLRWVHLDFQASVQADATLSLSLEKGTPAEIESKLVVSEQEGRIEVETGRINAEVLASGFNVFNRLFITHQYASDSHIIQKRG